MYCSRMMRRRQLAVALAICRSVVAARLSPCAVRRDEWMGGQRTPLMACLSSDRNECPPHMQRGEVVPGILSSSSQAADATAAGKSGAAAASAASNPQEETASGSSTTSDRRGYGTRAASSAVAEAPPPPKEKPTTKFEEEPKKQKKEEGPNDDQEDVGSLANYTALQRRIVYEQARERVRLQRMNLKPDVYLERDHPDPPTFTNGMFMTAMGFICFFVGLLTIYWYGLHKLYCVYWFFAFS